MYIGICNHLRSRFCYFVRWICFFVVCGSICTRCQCCTFEHDLTQVVLQEFSKPVLNLLELYGSGGSGSWDWYVFGSRIATYPGTICCQVQGFDVECSGLAQSLASRCSSPTLFWLNLSSVMMRSMWVLWFWPVEPLWDLQRRTCALKFGQKTETLTCLTNATSKFRPQT